MYYWELNQLQCTKLNFSSTLRSSPTTEGHSVSMMMLLDIFFLAGRFSSSVNLFVSWIASKECCTVRREALSMCNGKRHPLKKRKDRQLEQIKSWKEWNSLNVLMAIGYYSKTPTTSYRKGAGLHPCKAKKKYLALQGICLKWGKTPAEEQCIMIKITHMPSTMSPSPEGHSPEPGDAAERSVPRALCDHRLMLSWCSAATATQTPGGAADPSRGRGMFCSKASLCHHTTLSPNPGPCSFQEK